MINNKDAKARKGRMISHKEHKETQKGPKMRSEEGRPQANNIGRGGRNFWRIPVEAYNEFPNANHSFRL
jgi:hypothetical protein